MHERFRFPANWHCCFFLDHIGGVNYQQPRMWKNVIEERTRANFKFKRLGQTKTNTLMKNNVVMSLWPPSWMVMIICHYPPLTNHLRNCGSIFQWSISCVPYTNVHDGWSEDGFTRWWVAIGRKLPFPNNMKRAPIAKSISISIEFVILLSWFPQSI